MVNVALEGCMSIVLASQNALILQGQVIIPSEPRVACSKEAPPSCVLGDGGSATKCSERGGRHGGKRDHGALLLRSAAEKHISSYNEASWKRGSWRVRFLTGIFLRFM